MAFKINFLKPAFGQNEVRADIFPGSLAVFNPKGRADGGVGGGNAPAH